MSAAERIEWWSDHPVLLWCLHPCDEIWDALDAGAANDNSRGFSASAMDLSEQPNRAATNNKLFHLPLARGATASTRQGRGDAFRSEARTSVGRGLTKEDVEVGLQYFGKRYLNPLLGRWISADPLAVHLDVSTLEQRRRAAKERGEEEREVEEAWREWPDLNVYAYVRNRPLRNLDPLGLEDVDGVNTQDRGKIEAVCAVAGCPGALQAAKVVEMRNAPMARRMLDHFMSGKGGSVNVDLAQILRTDAGVNRRLHSAIGSDLQSALDRGENVVGKTGHVFVSQNDYDETTVGRDHKLALGGTHVYYRVTGVDGGKAQVQLYLSDSYFWSPDDASRPTQCLHQCGDKMVKEGTGKEFLQVGSAAFETSAPEQRMSVESAPEKLCSGDC